MKAEYSLGKESLSALLENKKEIQEILSEDYSNVSLAVCLPNNYLPTHKKNINFLMKVDNPESQDIPSLKTSILRELESLIPDQTVNIYTENEIAEKLKRSSLLSESDLEHLRATINCAIPLSEFNCQTNEELNQEFNKRFTEWQESQNTNSDDLLRKQEQLRELMGLTTGQFEKLGFTTHPEIMNIALKSLSRKIPDLSGYDKPRSRSGSPKPLAFEKASKSSSLEQTSSTN